MYTQHNVQILYTVPERQVVAIYIVRYPPCHVKQRAFLAPTAFVILAHALPHGAVRRRSQSKARWLAKSGPQNTQNKTRMQKKSSSQ